MACFRLVLLVTMHLVLCSFPGWQAPNARYGPEVHLLWHVQAGFLVFLHLALFCPRRTGKLDFWEWRVFFCGPLYLVVERLPEEYRVAYFREMTPGMFPYSLFLVQQRIHV